MVEIMVFV
jgi:hypothetical protein